MKTKLDYLEPLQPPYSNEKIATNFQLPQGVEAVEEDGEIVNIRVKNETLKLCLSILKVKDDKHTDLRLLKVLEIMVFPYDEHDHWSPEVSALQISAQVAEDLNINPEDDSWVEFAVRHSARFARFAPGENYDLSMICGDIFSETVEAQKKYTGNDSNFLGRDLE